MITTVFCTTVIRESQDKELTGYLYKINWNDNKIIKSIPIPIDTLSPFWNSRGGNRGGRGLAYRNGIIYVATSMSIIKYDIDLNKIGEITHPYLAGLHEIFLEEDGIWITSTLHDLIIKLGFDGELMYEWHAYEDELLKREFSFEKRDINLGLRFPEKDFVSFYERYAKEEIFHFNSLWVKDNYIYTLACFKKVLIQIKPETKIILKDNSLGSPHNSFITENNQVIINDTNNQNIKIYDMETGECVKTINTNLSGERIKSKQFITAGWQRGLYPLSHTVYLVGTSPATLFEVNINTGAIGQILNLDTDIRQSVHGIFVYEEE